MKHPCKSSLQWWGLAAWLRRPARAGASECGRNCKIHHLQCKIPRFITQFLVFSTKSLVFNTKFIMSTLTPLSSRPWLYTAGRMSCGPGRARWRASSGSQDRSRTPCPRRGFPAARPRPSPVTTRNLSEISLGICCVGGACVVTFGKTSMSVSVLM